MSDKETLDADRYRLEKAYRNILATVDGELVLNHIVQNLCGVYSPSLLQADPQATGHAIGRRDVGIAILNILHGERFAVKEGRTIHVRRDSR